MLPTISILGIKFGTFYICFGLGAIFFIVCASHFQVKRNQASDGISEILFPIFGLITALMGAYCYGVIEYCLKHGVFPDIFAFNYGSSSIGAITVFPIYTYLYSRTIKKPYISLFASACYAFPIMYLMGRMGCFLSGDGCYGIQTNSFVGMQFPIGLRPTTVCVYPTPLFEVIVMSLFLLIGISRRMIEWEFRSIIVSVLVAISIDRLLIEFIRNQPRIGWLTGHQWIALALLAYAFVLSNRLKVLK